MDNVTHALAGLLAAEVVVMARTPRGSTPEASFRRRAWFVSALTNNLPDFDFLYRRITEGQVGYLLHHRGHTHTLVVGLLLGLLTFAVADGLARRKARRAAPLAPKPDESVLGRERQTLFALSLAGPAIHIGMDFFNNYGVHPFWPLQNDWIYGDAIFIIEPWFVVFTVPPLYLACRASFAKALLGFTLAVGIGLAWLFPLVGPGTATALTLGAAFWSWWCRRARAETRALQSLVASLLVLFTFVVAGRSARARVLESQAHTGASRLDAVLTPAPSNPLCWSAITVAERNARYELRVATLSLAPWLIEPSGCRFEPSGLSLVEGGSRSSGRFEEHSAGGAVGNTPPGLRWDLTWNAPLPELVKLFRSNCQATAFLRYSRAPYWFPKQADRIYLGDLRYDRQPGLEFAEIEIPAHPEHCPRFVPPWRPPRHELLETR